VKIEESCQLLRENIYIIIFHVVPESVVPAQAVSTCVLDPTGVLTLPDTTSTVLYLHYCNPSCYYISFVGAYTQVHKDMTL
jgi:hypothetical protein